MEGESLLEQVFQEAADLEGAKRAAYLDQACAGDPALRKEVDQLLARLEKPSDFFEAPLLDTTLLEPAQKEDLPTRLGEYRILSVLGQGASGRVYEGEQARLHRRVALKVLKGHWDLRRVERRFQREIEILGLLEHPGICRIYEAGKADLIAQDGRSLGERLYFAMELVEGKPITRFARERQLDLSARLGLLLGVAEAVAAAHECGVLHRDLKPANILAMEGGTQKPETQTGRPRLPFGSKILDFGIGRILGEDAPDASRLTMDGAVFGTPAYMSPEQFSGNLGRIDTRSDVWALGVLGYELLSDQHPFLREGESPFVLRERILGGEAIPLGKRIKGLDRDVETLIQKAMEKDPDQRYPTAAGFAEDLRRILRNEPILARPPSLLYQLDRWARRHRALASGLAVGFLGLVLGLIFALWSASQARAERDRALLAQKDARDINTFFNQELIRVADPKLARGKVPDVYQLIDAMLQSLDGRFQGRPLVEARIRSALGKTFLSLSQFPKALAQLQKAQDLFQQGGEENSRDAFDNEIETYTLYSLTGKSNLALQGEQALLPRIRAELGDKDLLTLTVLGNMALHLQELGRLDQAKDKLLEVIHLREKYLGKEDSETLIAWNNYALFLCNLGEAKEAEEIDRRLLETRTRILGPLHPNTVTSLGNLSIDLLEQNKLPEALKFGKLALQRRKKVFGRGSPPWLKSCNILVIIYSKLLQKNKARALAREAYQVALEQFGLKHPDTLRLQNSLANLELETGNPQVALRLAKQSLIAAVDVYSKHHWRYGTYETTLARILLATGEKAKAAPYIKNASSLLEKTLGSNHRHTKRARRLLEKVLGG